MLTCSTSGHFDRDAGTHGHSNMEAYARRNINIVHSSRATVALNIRKVDERWLLSHTHFGGGKGSFHLVRLKKGYLNLTEISTYSEGLSL